MEHRVGHRRRAVLVAACAIAITGCVQRDTTTEPDDAPTSAAPTTVTLPAEPTSAIVVSVAAGDEQRPVNDDPAPLRIGPDGEPWQLVDMNESVEVQVVGARSLELRVTDNLCREFGRDVEVDDAGGTTRLLVRIGTSPECVPDPDSTIPSVEGLVEMSYIARIELDADLPDGSTPVAELVAA